MTNQSSPFAFYEIVQVNQTCTHSELVGLKGAVLGMAQGDDGTWHYSVALYDLEDTYSFDERELVATGEHDVRESFYDGTSIRVGVDPETGEGWIVEDGEKA